MEINPSARFQPRELGSLQTPGCCAVCGNGTCIDGYLDIGVWLEYYGQVYLCNNCVNESIETWQGLTASVAKHLQETNEALATEVVELRARNELLSTRLRVFDAAVLDAAVGAGFGPISEQDAEGTETDSNEPADLSGSGESESKESVTSERSSDANESQLRDGSPLSI